MIKRIIIFSMFFSIFVGTFFSLLLTNIKIENNENQNYCDIIAYVSDAPKEAERTYIAIKKGDLVKYNSKLHTNKNKFYIISKNSKYAIRQANWTSQNRLCKLNIPKIIQEFSIGFISLSAFIFLIFTPLLILISSIFSSVNKIIFKEKNNE